MKNNKEYPIQINNNDGINKMRNMRKQSNFIIDNNNPNININNRYYEVNTTYQQHP